MARSMLDGFLFSIGSLSFNGFLLNLGSFVSFGLLTLSLLARLFWVASLKPTRFSSLGFSSLLARFTGVGFCSRLTRLPSLGFFQKVARLTTMVFSSTLTRSLLSALFLVFGSLNSSGFLSSIRLAYSAWFISTSTRLQYMVFSGLLARFAGVGSFNCLARSLSMVCFKFQARSRSMDYLSELAK